MSKLSVVIPTYNESENIRPLLERIAGALRSRDYEVIIVDDNSPDGTAALATSLSGQYPVTVVKRPAKLGLGSAVQDGVKASRGDVICVMDADLQHPPELITSLFEAIEKGYDVCIASRYVKGGGVENWSVLRKVISRGATVLAWPVVRVKDPMSGYFAAKRDIITAVDFSTVGYKVLLSILTQEATRGKKVGEIPYIFVNRRGGSSKRGYKEYVRYLRLLGRVYLSSLRRLVGLRGN